MGDFFLLCVNISATKAAKETSAKPFGRLITSDPADHKGKTKKTNKPWSFNQL